VLDREFRVERPDRVYAGDITYIQTDEGWLYLAVLIDLYSRAVVGWAMSERMTAQLVNDALMMAVWKRKPQKIEWFIVIVVVNMPLSYTRRR
jgi:transposase InsO family protein